MQKVLKNDKQKGNKNRDDVTKWEEKKTENFSLAKSQEKNRFSVHIKTITVSKNCERHKKLKVRK